MFLPDVDVINVLKVKQCYSIGKVRKKMVFIMFQLLYVILLVSSEKNNKTKNDLWKLSFWKCNQANCHIYRLKYCVTWNNHYILIDLFDCMCQHLKWKTRWTKCRDRMCFPCDFDSDSYTRIWNNLLIMLHNLGNCLCGVYPVVHYSCCQRRYNVVLNSKHSNRNRLFNKL